MNDLKGSLKGLVVILPFLLVLGCDNFSSKGHLPMVFSVNLSSSKAELRLLESKDPVFEVKGIEPFEARPLMSVKASRGVTLAEVNAENQIIAEWKDPSGVPYNLRLENGKIYCIIVDSQGNASMQTLSQDYVDDPKITVLNGTSEALAQVQVAPDFNKNVKVYVQDLPPSQPTEFFTLKSKSVGFFWQTAGQTFTSEFFRLEKANAPLLQNMENGHFYLLLAANGLPGDGAHGKLWDLTPKEK